MSFHERKWPVGGKDIFMIGVALGTVALLIVFLVLVGKEQNRQNEELQSLARQEETWDRGGKAQDICINEICGDGWIELYNRGGREADVSGYRIVCGEGEATLPEGTVIGKREFLAVELPVRDHSSAALYGSEGELYDSVYVVSAEKKESYARREDGGISFAYLNPSEGRTNAGEETIPKEFIYFSIPGGFYDEDIRVEIPGREDVRIYYTLDGSVPGPESLLYEDGILVKNRTVEDNVYSALKGLSVRTNYIPGDKVEKCTVIRAVAIDRKGNRSNEIVSCYWIANGNKMMYGNMPVLSVCADPEELFGYEYGLYSKGKIYEDALAGETAGDTSANYYADYRAEAYVHYFSGSKVQIGEGKGVLQTCKDGYLDYIQKSLVLCGDGKSCLLSAGKADYTIKIRDLLVQELLEEAEISVKKVQPCTVFLDGEYWGVYLLSSPADEFAAESSAGISDDGIVCIAGGKSGDPEKQKLYDEFYEYVVNSDFTDDSEYEKLKERMDIQSYLNCYCAHLYIADSGWAREKEIAWRWLSDDELSDDELSDDELYNDELSDDKLFDGGKWRYVFSGADAGMGNSELSTPSINTYLRPAVSNDPFLYSLLRNGEFRRQFIRTMETCGDQVFEASRAQEKVRELAGEYKRGIRTSFARFSGNLSEGSYEAEINKIIDFFEKRKEYILKYTREFVYQERKLRSPEENKETDTAGGEEQR